MVYQNVNVNIRVTEEVRGKFYEIAKKKNETPSREIRKLMKLYIKKNGNLDDIK